MKAGVLSDHSKELYSTETARFAIAHAATGTVDVLDGKLTTKESRTDE
jgi:hypothetical protein